MSEAYGTVTGITVDGKKLQEFVNRMNKKAIADPVTEVPEFLEGAAGTFRERNAVYGSNYRMVGHIMMAMFPDGPPALETAEDYNKWHLFELAIVKLSRYAINYDIGHADSLEDMIVYLAMVAKLDEGAERE